MVGEAGELPYERPGLSQDVLMGKKDVDSLYVHDRAWYDEHAVETVLDDAVASLDVEGRTEPGSQTLQLYDVVQLAHHFGVSRSAALMVQSGSRWLRARIEPMALAAPSCIFWLPVPASARPALLQAQLLPSLPGILPDNRRRPRAYRNETLHLRALQALDGVAAGATQREIAQVIFGQEHVQDGWHADSSLRRQIRHYLSRGNFFMREGYLDLLTLR